MKDALRPCSVFLKAVEGKGVSQRVRVGTWHMLGPQRSYSLMTLEPMYVL